MEADLRFVSLPLIGADATALATVPPELLAHVSQAVLPAALQAGRAGERAVALPVATRWMALAWNPTRLEEFPSAVPPHLEAWIEQLRALRRTRREHAPVVVAWAESEIAGSFALLLAAAGGRLLDEAGQPAFTGPEGEATVQLMAQMLDDGLVQTTALETTTERLAKTLNGTPAYWLCSSDAFTTQLTSDRLQGLRIGGLPMTRERYRYPDSASVALVQFRGLAVSADSSRTAAAWRMARFLSDPVVLRSAPPGTSVLVEPPAGDSLFLRQARSLDTRTSSTPWLEPPGLSQALGRFLHAALRRLLTPREALERAALQFRQPGALPETGQPSDDRQRLPDETAAPAGSATPEETGPASSYPGPTEAQPNSTAGPTVNQSGPPPGGVGMPPSSGSGTAQVPTPPPGHPGLLPPKAGAGP